MMKWYMHACPVCGGDIFEELDDPLEGTCLMCGREFPLAAIARLHVVTEHSGRGGMVLAPVGESSWRGIAEMPQPSASRRGRAFPHQKRAA
jgi:hypothetical protein